MTCSISSSDKKSMYWYHHHRKRPSFYYPSNIVKSSPYIGIFRHAPPAWESIQTSIDKQKNSSRTGPIIISGRLPGGGKSFSEDDDNSSSFDNYPPLVPTWLDRKVSASIMISNNNNRSNNQNNDDGWRRFNALDLLHGGIMILPFLLRKVLSLNNPESNDEDENDDRSEETNSTQLPQDQLPVLDVAPYSGIPETRLDYVITQMDICRMARNASRHLDVKSILALPTVTFRSSSMSSSRLPAVKQVSGSTSSVLDSGWSWQMVPIPPPVAADEEVKDEENCGEGNDPETCIICLENFMDGDTLRVLPCSHSFHMGCIDHWLLGTYSEDNCFTSGCPTCKKRPTRDKASRLDGSVPSWAFERLGDVLAKEMNMGSSDDDADVHSGEVVTVNHDITRLDTSALSLSGVVYAES